MQNELEQKNKIVQNYDTYYRRTENIDTEQQASSAGIVEDDWRTEGCHAHGLRFLEYRRRLAFLWYVSTSL